MLTFLLQPRPTLCFLPLSGCVTKPQWGQMTSYHTSYFFGLQSSSLLIGSSAVDHPEVNGAARQLLHARRPVFKHKLGTKETALPKRNKPSSLTLIHFKYVIKKNLKIDKQTKNMNMVIEAERFFFFSLFQDLHHDLVFSGNASDECAGGVCLLKVHKTASRPHWETYLHPNKQHEYLMAVAKVSTRHAAVY